MDRVERASSCGTPAAKITQPLPELLGRHSAKSRRGGLGQKGDLSQFSARSKAEGLKWPPVASPVSLNMINQITQMILLVNGQQILYVVTLQNSTQEVERNQATAKNTQSPSHAWLLFSYTLQPNL